MTGMMTCLLCVVSCGFGCSCGLFVIAIVWIYMRPLLGSSRNGPETWVLVNAPWKFIRLEYQKVRKCLGKWYPNGFKYDYFDLFLGVSVKYWWHILGLGTDGRLILEGNDCNRK